MDQIGIQLLAVEHATDIYIFLEQVKTLVYMLKSLREHANVRNSSKKLWEFMETLAFVQKIFEKLCKRSHLFKKNLERSCKRSHLLNKTLGGRSNVRTCSKKPWEVMKTFASVQKNVGMSCKRLHLFKKMVGDRTNTCISPKNL